MNEITLSFIYNRYVDPQKTADKILDRLISKNIAVPIVDIIVFDRSLEDHKKV